MIHLQRKIKVRTFEAEGTVAIGRDRPEFLAVARLAADLRRPISGKDITRELLGNLPEQVGWRVLDRALALGLLERRDTRGPATLSASGRAMLEYNEVLVPEEGVWRFYIVEDQLVERALVHVQRLDIDDAREERNRLYRQRSDRSGRGVRIPEALADLVRVPLRSAVDESSFEVRELGQRGEPGGEEVLVVSLEWAQGEAPSVYLRGRLSGGTSKDTVSVDRKLSISAGLEKLSYPDVWTALVSGATKTPADHLHYWRRQAGKIVLPTNMEPWKHAERRTFMTTLAIPKIRVAGIGHFEESRLEGVELVAENPAAAQMWGEWLLWDSISAYVVRSDIERAREDVRARFPMHRPNLSDADDLLRRARRDPQEKTAKFILAPADLGLWS